MTVTSFSVRLVAVMVFVLRQRLQAALVVSAPKGVGPPPSMHRKCPVWKDSMWTLVQTYRQTDKWGRVSPEGTSVSTPLSSATFKKICRTKEEVPEVNQMYWVIQVNEVDKVRPGQIG